MEAEVWSFMPSSFLGNLFGIHQFITSNSWLAISKFSSENAEYWDPSCHSFSLSSSSSFLYHREEILCLCGLRVSWLCWQGQLKPRTIKKPFLNPLKRIQISEDRFTQLLLQGAWKQWRPILHCGWWWIESSRGDNQKWGLDIWLEL